MPPGTLLALMCSHQHTPCVWDRAWFKPVKPGYCRPSNYAPSKTQVFCIPCCTAPGSLEAWAVQISSCRTACRTVSPCAYTSMSERVRVCEFCACRAISSCGALVFRFQHPLTNETYTHARTRMRALTQRSHTNTKALLFSSHTMTHTHTHTHTLHTHIRPCGWMDVSSAWMLCACRSSAL